MEATGFKRGAIWRRRSFYSILVCKGNRNFGNSKKINPKELSKGVMNGNRVLG